MRKIAYLFAMFFFAFNLLAGCATQTTTTKTVKNETVQHSQEMAEDRRPEPVVVEKQQTTEATEEGKSGGALSSTVHVVGQVLALPFRAVGGLIELVF